MKTKNVKKKKKKKKTFFFEGPRNPYDFNIFRQQYRRKM